MLAVASTGFALLLLGPVPHLLIPVGVGLLAIVTVAGVGGAMLPLMLEKVGVDPAVAMRPFVTSASDLINLSIYLGWRCSSGREGADGHGEAPR